MTPKTVYSERLTTFLRGYLQGWGRESIPLQVKWFAWSPLHPEQDRGNVSIAEFGSAVLGFPTWADYYAQRVRTEHERNGEFCGDLTAAMAAYCHARGW